MKNKMKSRINSKSGCIISLLSLPLLNAVPAYAHHPLAGAPMETFTQGVLSGIGHPVLGFDHLFFMVAVGIAAVFTGRQLLAPLFYLAAMVVGVLLCVSGTALPAVEHVIAASIVVLGALVLMGRRLSLPTAGVMFAGAGLFHGWAFGQSIAGVEAVGAPVLAGYLIGLLALQWLVAVGAGYFASSGWKALSSDMRPRLTGALVTGVGIVYLLEGFEPLVLAAVGLA